MAAPAEQTLPCEGRALPAGSHSQLAARPAGLSAGPSGRGGMFPRIVRGGMETGRASTGDKGTRGLETQQRGWDPTTSRFRGKSSSRLTIRSLSRRKSCISYSPPEAAAPVRGRRRGPARGPLLGFFPLFLLCFLRPPQACEGLGPLPRALTQALPPPALQEREWAHTSALCLQVRNGAPRLGTCQVTPGDGGPGLALLRARTSLGVPSSAL